MKILFLNNKETHCGVADYGRRVFTILQSHFDIMFAEVNEWEQIPKGFDTIIYNYHHATMPFVKDENLDRSIKHVAIFHEGPMNFTPDKVLTTEIRPLYEGIQLPEYKNGFELIGEFKQGFGVIPVIGSFGFGFPDKNFQRVAEEVASQYDKAVLRLLIPFAYYGDRDGFLAKQQAERCRDVLKGTNIELRVSHDYLQPIELLHWLNQNDLNLFLYKLNQGRGLASATDYALSVNKPIGVSNSEMFRHLPTEICIDNTPLKELTVEMLKEVKDKNSNERLVDYYKREICL